MKKSTRQNKKQPLHKNAPKKALLAVIPHKANNYQPHLIRRYGLLVVLLLVIGVQFIYNFGMTGSVLGEKVDVSTEALLQQTNQARQEEHLSSLKLSDQLNHAAYLKVQDMFAKQYWSHDAPDGTKPWKWFATVGYTYSEAGENLAKDFYTAEATTTAWMNSSEHRANILEPGYTEVGFAVKSGMLDGKPATIIVALYGRPASIGATQANATVLGAQGGSPNLLTRLGIGIRSMTPAVLGSIILLGFVILVAYAAHLYRDRIPKLPKQPRHRYNHGVIKMGGVFSLILIMLLLYGGGQI